MSIKQEYKDPLADLFKNMKEEPLPASFRANVMQQIAHETAKAKKRNERISLLSMILASLFMIASGFLSLLYIDLPKIAFPKIDPSSFHFYLFIGGLTLLLLFLDYRLRQYFCKEK